MTLELRQYLTVSVVSERGYSIVMVDWWCLFGSCVIEFDLEGGEVIKGDYTFKTYQDNGIMVPIIIVTKKKEC